MKCRFCEKELVNGEEKRFETLCDHVSNPNATDYPLRPTFVCEDPECIANKVAVGFWDELGSFYYKNWGAEELKPYGEYNAINSHARQSEIEICKDDENFTIWKGWKWQLRIHYKYKANEAGEILERKPELIILRRNFRSFLSMFKFWDMERSWVYHTTNFKSLKYCKDRYLRLLSEIEKEKSIENKERVITLIGRFHELLDDKDKYYKEVYFTGKLRDIVYRDYQWYRKVYAKWVEKRVLVDLLYIELILKDLK